MNDVIFEQDKEPQRPYTAKVLLNRARNPRLCLSQPKVNPGSWLGNLLRRQRMNRAQIIEKAADDLWLTLEKRDGIFVFRFPDDWDADDVQDMQRRVLEGIAMLEARFSLIVWLRDLFGNISAGMARLWETMLAPITMSIIGVALLLGTIYAFSVGSTGWSIALFLVALSGCSVKISVSFTEGEERNIVSTRRGGGQSNSALLALMALIETKIPKEEPLKSDDLYEEPQATYPMEMRI